LDFTFWMGNWTLVPKSSRKKKQGAGSQNNAQCRKKGGEGEAGKLLRPNQEGDEVSNLHERGLLGLNNKTSKDMGGQKGGESKGWSHGDKRGWREKRLTRPPREKVGFPGGGV